MNGPITNFELGKMRHQEYEAEVSPFWGRNMDGDDNPRASKRVKLILALSGAALAIPLIIQMLVF